jgi:hypothetical protein
LLRITSVLAFVLTVARVGAGQSKAPERASELSGCSLDVKQFGRTSQTSPELINLQTRLVDPHFPVTQELILQLSAQEGREVSSIQRATNGPALGEVKATERTKEQVDSAGKYLDILIYALPQKKSEALAESLSTLVQNQFLRTRPMNTATRRCLQETVVKLLPSLPFQDEWGILFAGDYELFKSEPLAAYLQQVYETLESRVQDSESDREQTLRSYRTGILKRIYEADAGRGRNVILIEIASELPRSDIEALKILPDEVLPSMDRVFAAQLPLVYKNATWLEYRAKLEVIERYASAAVLPEMKSIYLNDPDERNEDQGFIFFSYFLRTDPTFGRELVEQSARGNQSNCSNVLFTQLMEIRVQPDLREIARKHLSDENKCVAANAAYVFKYTGNAEVEALLWQLLQAWHDEWAGRKEPIPYPEQSYEDSLVEALLFGGGPCELRDTVEKLRALYIKGKSVDGNIRFLPWHNPVRITIRMNTFEDVRLDVDSCPGSIKMEQLIGAIPRFPEETQFEWNGPADPFLESFVAPVRVEIERAIKQNGMSFHVHGKN